MVFVKFDNDAATAALTKVGSILDSIKQAKCDIDDFVNSFSSVNKDDYFSKHESCVSKNDYTEVITEDDGSTREEFNESGWKNAVSAHLNGVYSELQNYIVASNFGIPDLDKLSTYLTNVQTGLNSIITAVSTFDGSTSSLAEKLGELDGINVTTNDDGIEIVTYSYTVNGVTFTCTIAEMVNAFYTYTGSAMNNVIAAGILASNNLGDADALLTAAVQNAGAFTNVALGAGFMGVADADNIKAMYQKVSGNVYSEDTVKSKYNEFLEKLKEKYGDAVATLFGSDTGAFVTGALGTGVASGLLTAYSLTDKFNDDMVNAGKKVKGKDDKGNETEFNPFGTNPEPESEVSPTTDGGTDNPDYTPGGGYDNPGGGTPPSTPGTIPAIVDLFDLKDVEFVTIPPITRDLDAEARLAFEASDKTSYTAEVIELRNVANELYENPDKSGLISKLSQYGYSDGDIQIIITDRELTIAAILDGDRRLKLGSIVDELAKASSITDYTSSYSSKPTLEGILDGTAAVLLADFANDEKLAPVVEAYNTTKTAYDKAYGEYLTSYTTYTEAKTNLDTVTAELEKAAGTDKTKWTAEQVTKYNEAAEKYNEAAKTTKEKMDESNKLKEDNDKNKEAYEKAKDEYLAKVKEEYVQHRNATYTDFSDEGETPLQGDSSNKAISSTSDEDLLNLFLNGNGSTNDDNSSF